MITDILERCRRICGDESDACFVASKKQVICIIDMVVNRISGIRGIIDAAREENDPRHIAEILSSATEDIDKLLAWVNFLYFEQDLRHLLGLFHEEGTIEDRRREWRYPMPFLYRKFISVEITSGNDLIRAHLVDFSRSGLKLAISRLLRPGAEILCRISFSRNLSKDLSVAARIRHCRKAGTGYVAGAEILDVADEDSFVSFRILHDFVVDRVRKEQRGNRQKAKSKQRVPRQKD